MALCGSRTIVTAVPVITAIGVTTNHCASANSAVGG